MIKTFYLPDLFNDCYEIFKEKINNVSLLNIKLNDTFFKKINEFYENAFNILLNYSINNIIKDIDLVSKLFLDTKYEDRILAIDNISKITNFSKESVTKSIDLEFTSSLKDDIELALKDEFNTIEILDNFVLDESKKRLKHVIANGPIFAVTSANIPALPHLSIMRAFLTKNPIIVKTSYKEPIFTPLYMEAFKKINSPLADCAIVLCYESKNIELTKKLIETVNIIIAYGGVKTEKFFFENVKHPKKLIMHSHKLGFGIIGEGFTLNKTDYEIEKLANLVANDVATFEQQACLAPHVYFYCTKNNIPTETFIQKLILAFERYEEILPYTNLSENMKFERNNFINSLYFNDDVIEIYKTKSKNSIIVDTKFKSFPISLLNRMLFIIRFEKLQEVINILKPISKFLQNVALCVKKDEENIWFNALSKLNVSRICNAGEMPSPTMMWHHDGLCTLKELVRFCDVEKYNL